MSYKALKIDLTEKQILQALKGKPIRVAPGQINVGNNFISLHPANVKKVENAFLKKKGFTLLLSHGELADTAHRMQGSGFWSNVWNAIKKGWRVLKDTGVLTQVADAAVAPLSAYTGQPGLVTGTRKLLKETTGVGIFAQQNTLRSKGIAKSNSAKRMSKSDKFDQMRAAGIYLS